MRIGFWETKSKLWSQRPRFCSEKKSCKII